MASASFQRKLESRGQWAEHFVSEQRSEAIFAAKEIALSPEPALSPVEGAPRNDRVSP